jgi:HPt (histidine-containing phosphotransfer) domain-containing protein
MESADSSPYPLLDPEQIKMLLESGADESIELFVEILGMFEEESQAKFLEMQSAVDAGNHEALGRAVHALAGSSANIGGRVTWLKAREIENLCKAGEGTKAIALLGDLRETYDATVVQMKAYVENL